MFSTHGIAIGNDETHHIKFQSDETSAESECAICMDSYKHRESVVTLPCEHEFHTNCLKFWFKTKLNCPFPAKNGSMSNGSNAICENCSIFTCLLGILLLGICCVAEEYSIELRVKPSLGRDHPYFYYAEVKCTSKEAFVPINALFEHFPGKSEEEKKTTDDEYDFARVNLGNEKCPGGFQIGIAMFNGSYPEDFGWYTWGAKKPLVLRGIQFEENNFAMVQNVEFANHFKLDISPKLADTSNLVYRVNVLCVDNDQQLVFETFTQSETIVVFNSIKGPNCGTYDVKVWPTFLNWLDKSENEINSFLETEFSLHGIGVKNGEMHHINFPTLAWKAMTLKLTLWTMIRMKLMMWLIPMAWAIKMGKIANRKMTMAVVDQ
ncbi:hypothetical protein niasHS_011292 [Heterodera schachtii]|uniref:RING-type E3 ubiquitin transferase n=1 Tax=Heterodera schachtii TaxID=97005 RepID=A0ABD2J1K3_HETSC